ALPIWILLSKYLNKRKDAFPVLETNLKNSKKGDTIPEVLIEYGRCCHYMGKYTEAIAGFKAVLPFCTNTKSGNELRTLMNKYIQQCEYGQANSEGGEDLVLIHLNDAVNSTGSGYVPIYLPKDSTVLFTSRRSTGSGLIDGKDGKYYEEIYESKESEGDLGTARKVNLKLSSKVPQHASVSSVSPDGNTIFLVINGKLFSSTYKNGELTEPVDLGPNINMSKYQNHICMTADGKTVYFSSDSKNGQGGLDIWKSTKQSDGTWGKAENLGPDVNTPDDEESPAILPDGKTLYFSSRGHRGFGGYDLFRSDWDGTKFTSVSNLGAPVNSPGDDTYLILEQDGTFGYFASDRASGYGDMDIYILVFPQEDQEFACDFSDHISIKTDQKSKKQRLILSAVLDDGLKAVEYAWKIDGRLIKKAKGDVLDTLFTDGKKHSVHVEARVVSGSRIVLYCADAEVEHQPEALIAVTNETTITTVNTTTETKSNPEPKLITVYFDYDKSGIRPDAASTLSQNAKVLKSNRELKVAVSGHADSRGTDEYNEELSRRRVNAVVNYLVSLGVSRSQIITITAKGESELLNNCSDTVPCSDDDHQKNRRVEFKIQ
ncbi:MAG TPA: hypothetical protein DEP18_07110, partial [Flavobacteriales bacterium]|nr:hypothetical protein [Flavobacteriales bacterium]